MSDQQSAHRRSLSDELGVDVEILEARLVFGIDAARIGRGEPAELTYIRIKRHHAPNALIVAPADTDGHKLLQEHPLISQLRQEHHGAEFTVLDDPQAVDLKSVEIILL